MKKEDMTKTMTLILNAGLTFFGGFDNGPGKTSTLIGAWKCYFQAFKCNRALAGIYDRDQRPTDFANQPKDRPTNIRTHRVIGKLHFQ